MPQTFVITGRIEFSGDANLLLGGRVEAYDRDLPSLEQRGKAPQLLGQSPINDETFQFRIEFTDEQFRQTGNGSTGLRQPTKINPNLSFKVFDATGREQTVTGIVPQGGSDPVQIIFNAPSNLESITIQVAPIPEITISQYERLIALITPVIASIPLADLTDADVAFLVNQHGEQFDGESLQDQIEWLRRSALLAQQTNLPIESLYAWGRKISITNSPNDLPSVLRGLLIREDTELSQTLQAAIAENIIPAQLGDRIPQILAQLERVRVNQGLLVARQFVGKLLNERTGEPLVGYRVQGFDLDAGDQPKQLGQAFSNEQGVFSLTYITPPTPDEAAAEQRQRSLRLEVYINSQNQEKFEVEVQAGADQDVQDVPVTLPAPQETLIEQLPGLSRIESSPGSPTVARLTAVPEPATSSDLIAFLQDQNITTLEALRNAGGIRQLENLPSDVDETQIELVESHEELYPLTHNVETSDFLIRRNYSSLAQIARTSQSDFMNDLRDRADDINAAELHAVARAQTAFLNNQLYRDAADRANGLETRSLGSENVRCTCQSCESAVSPLAYLTDLLKFATENIKKPNLENPDASPTEIKATDLTDILYQPFDKLRASCEAVDTPVRQVRLCIEVLRGYLKAKPPADLTKLATAEKQYLLAAYTSLLTKLGTSFSEIRLARNSEPSLRQSLADRLGIDISHVNALFLDPNPPENPEATAPKPLTEASLEELLGLVDTTRNPLAEGVKLGDAEPSQITTWNLNNVQPGVNTDQEGKVYVKLSKVPNLEGHDGVVRSVAFSPDGQFIVSGSVDQTVRLWNAQTRQPIGDPLQGHNSPVYSVAFSPDGSRVVSGGGDNKLRVWDTQTRQQIGELSGHDSAVYSVAFSPDGQRIVSGGGDKKLRLWDAQSLQLIAVSQEEHDDSVTSVAFSPDGQRIVSGSTDQKLRLWDAQLLQPLGVPLEGHNTVVWSVAFSPDGQSIVSGGFKTLRLWDTQTGQTIRELEGHESGVLSVAFSPDGSRIVSGGFDKTLRLWNTQTGQAIGRPLEGHTDLVWSVMFSPDGQRIVSGSEDKTVRLWNAQTRRPSTGVVRAELYQDKPLQDGSFEAKNLVASGDISTDSGTVKLLPENKSGLYGVLDVAYVVDSNSISIVAVPEFLNWRLQHLRTLWKAQDWTTDAYEETQSAVTLKQLPANITLTPPPGNTFPSPLEAIKYDRDHQRLIRSTGVMTIEERQRLLALSSDKDFQQAVEQLFQVSQRLPQSAVTLKQLPGSITNSASPVFTFASPLEAISYNRDRQQLIRSAGVMTTTEREGLLSRAPIASGDSENDQEIKRQFQEAVKQLFQISQRLPIIDPDLVGPDDFRNPKADASDKVFALWEKRSKWVSNRLDSDPQSSFASKTKTIPIQNQDQTGTVTIPDIDKMLAEMSDEVTYILENGTSIRFKTWESQTTFANLKAIQNELNEGKINEIKIKLQDELNLTVESFTRLLAIADKAQAWETDQREEKVSDEEWYEFYSILMQAQKIKVFPTWRQEEKNAQIHLAPESFWLSQTQPLEGTWPQKLSTEEPTIDPSILKLKDLPDAVVGEQAILLWNERQKALAQIPNDLEKKLKDSNGFDSTDGFDLVVKEALGGASIDLERIQDELSNPATVDEAIAEINSLINSSNLTDALTVESFRRLLNIRTKVGTSDKPTRAEWAEVYTILTKPYKIKVLYPTWIREETPEETQLPYWQLLKAKLPRWRASNESRQAWLQALLDRSQAPLIDPDLIDPGDLKNSVEGDAFAIWKRRETAITDKLESLNTRPKDLAGLEQRFQDTLDISKDDFLKVAETQVRGEIIADRLVQLSLEFAEFNYLLRVVRLLQQNQQILDAEWENVNSILVQVWKQRQAAKWRSEEREEGVFRSPDFFQIQFQDTPANPSREADSREIWRSPRLVYLDWQEQLQTRIDQEQQTIQAYRAAIGAAEEETLEQLRDALVLAIDVQGNLEAKAKWVTENLLIDAKTSSSITTTRVAQAIESLQTLFLVLRTGRSEEQFKDLTLNQENYDKAWKILGSYTSWRATMFVFLYPENLLQPSLRKWQTPAFETLVSSTFLNGDFTINDIKRIIEEYSNYIARITFLQVDATCLIGNRFYMFGASTELRGIFWSYSDAKQILENSQPIWYQIKVDSEDQKLLDSGQIFGAYCGFEHIYLFLSIQDFSGDLAISTLTSINFLKYNHKVQKWADKLISLGLPINTKSVCFIDGISIYSSPRMFILQERDYSVFELLGGSVQNDGWLSSSFESFGLITPDALIYYPFISLKAAFEIENGRIVVICDVVVTIDNEDRSEVFYILCNNNSILSITPSGRYGKYAGSFTLTQADREPIYFLVKSEESDVPELVKLEVTTDDNINEQSISIVGSIYTQLRDFFYTAPRFGRDKGLDPGSSFLNRIVISKSDNNLNNPILSCCPYINTNNELVLLSNPGLEIGSQIEAYKPFLVKPISLSDILDLNLLTIVGLTSQGLQSRRIAIKKVIENNLLWDVYDRLDYLKEILFFIPIYFANSLSNTGEYLAALDLYRTVYDYAADQNGDTHIIYYGFVLEKNLPLTYRKAQDWLLNPLNSHAIAETRQNGYLRFTFFAIIRCLLEFADSEFTQDTSESTGRARSLYLTAQELLESKELKQSIAGCDEVIGFLDDVEPDDPRWRSAFFAIREGVNSLSDLQTRRRVVPEIQAALQATEPIAQRFVNARAILDRVTAEIAPAPTLPQVIEQTENTNRQMQHTLMLAPALQPALETLRLTARAATVPTSQLPPDYIPLLVTAFCIPVNPILQSLRLRTETSLKKLRAGLNIAGLKRQLEPYAAPTDAASGLPTIGAGGQLVSSGATINLQPTLYRYQVLIERAKQLVQLAAQVETGFLSAEAGFLGAKAGGLGAIAGVQSDEEKREDKRFEKGYSILKAQQDLGLALAGKKLQDLRLTEANNAVDLADLQWKRAIRETAHYDLLIAQDRSAQEEEGIKFLQNAADNAALATSAVVASAAGQIISGTAQGAQTGGIIGAALIPVLGPFGPLIGAGVGAVFGGSSSSKSAASAKFSARANENSIKSSLSLTQASFERRLQDWQFRRDQAKEDQGIGSKQWDLANDRVGIVTQEGAIAQLQATNAQDAVKYLEDRITENPELTNTLKLTVEQFQLTAELYDYIRNVLQGVYRYFLQQATAIAKLAENQLAFERQEVPPTYIQSDYWSVPINDTTTSNPNTATPDRRGLTGSARLLQDVYQLDQYAFTTNKRKLQLTKTFSLSSLAPVEFQQFRETGVLLFSTPMELFDRDFPGHYLRLIRRVRTSVIALIPPTQGIKATLSTVGITRVVVGPDIFQTIPIRRDPEFVALTSPTNATGLFELESLQPDFLLPFEGNGVDSSWEFRMPKAANQFDYRTIADVLITIEYTALNSNDYRQQVIQTLNPNLSSDRPFSFRNQFADQWYDLNNPEQTKTPMQVKFQTFREDFPPNLETLKIQQVLLYFVRASEKTVEFSTAELRFTEQGNQGTVGGSATPIDSVVSTRRGNASSWTPMIGKTPVGEWELTLLDTEEVRQRFQNEEIDDILFVITYSGRTPEWPA